MGFTFYHMKYHSLVELAKYLLDSRKSHKKDIINMKYELVVIAYQCNYILNAFYLCNSY